MPSVIDSLIIELGLDATGLNQAIQQAKANLASLSTTAGTTSKSIENIFMTLRGGIFGIIAALGLGAIAKFVEGVMHMDAQTSRLSRSLNVSTRELSVWQGVLKQVGGTAEDANSFFSSLADTLAGIRLGLTMPSGELAFFLGQTGLNMRTATPEQVAERMPGFVQQQRAMGRPEDEIRVLLKGMGANDAAVFAAMHGNFAQMRAAAEKVGPLTKGQGEAAEGLVAKQALVAFGFDRFASKTLPALEKVVNLFTNSVQKFSDDLLKWVGITPAPDRGPTTGAGKGAARPPWGGGPLLGDITGLGGSGEHRIPYGALAVKLGATGSNHGWATFPTPEIEQNAVKAFDAAGGIHERTTRDSITSGTFRSRFPIPTPQSTDGKSDKQSTINIGTINVASAKADPKDVAAAIPAQIVRMASVGGVDSGLTG